MRKLLNQTIDEMELSVRSYNCLQAAGIKYIHKNMGLKVIWSDSGEESDWIRKKKLKN